MHEYSIVQALVGRVEQEVKVRQATAVHRLRVRLGELSGVDPELFTTAYETFRAGTVCADAVLELGRVEAQWACRQCHKPIVKGSPLQCAWCGTPAKMIQGDEILLDQIDLEVP